MIEITDENLHSSDCILDGSGSSDDAEQPVNCDAGDSGGRELEAEFPHEVIQLASEFTARMIVLHELFDDLRWTVDACHQ